MTNVAETLEARLNSLLCKLEQLYTDNYGSPDTQSWLDAFHRFLLDGLVVFFEDERSCWWCDPARRPIVTEILHVFSLPESDSVVRFKQINACMLSRCRGCIAGYYTAKEQLRKLYRRRYPPENIDRFFSIIDTWDQARLIRGLSTTNEINNTPNTTSTLTTSLYEIFSVSKLLHCTLIRDAVNTAIINTPKSILATLPLSMAVTQLPGIFCLVCSNQSQVRNWAAHVIMESIEYNSTLQWKDTLQQQQQQKEEKQKQNEENTNYNDTVDKVAQSYGIVTQYVIRSSIQQQQQQSYATFTARFWRLTYKLVRSLPADKEKRFIKQHGSVIFRQLAEEICVAIQTDFITFDKSRKTAWSTAVITFNWFATRYVDIAVYHISPEKIANIIQVIIKYFNQLQADLATNETKESDTNDAHINLTLNWTFDTVKLLFQLPNGNASLNTIYSGIQSTIQSGDACSIHCQHQWLSGLLTVCQKMATEGSYDRLANFIKFLDQHSAEDTFTSGILVELTGKLVKEGIAGLSEAIDPEPTQDIVAKQLPEQRGVACSPMIWSALDKVQNIKAKNAILNAGVAIIYLWWRTPKAENDEVQHRRITFPYVIDVLYRCFVHCADTCNDNEKTDELLIINGCLLSMLSGIATTTNPDHERTWTPYMEKLCRADHGLDLALQRIFSRTNDQVDATIQMSLQKFNQYHQSITSAAGARYLRLLHALLRTWFSKEAVSRRGSYLMTLWSPLWRVLVHAMWLAGGSSSVIDRKEIRQRVISIANRLIRWQTTELKDDYVACVQLQPCVVSLADWYQLGHKELPSNDQHSNDKEVDWRASLVKAIVHTVQFISRHLGLDASAMEAVKQLVDNTPIIDGILSREQVQTLKRALCRKPDLDLDALLDMNTDIDLDDDDVEVNTKTNTSQALPTSKEILDPSKKHISTSMNMESTSASTSSTVPKTRTNEDLLSEPTKRSRVEVTVPVRTISRIDQIVEKKSPTTTTRPSEQPSARSISKAWKGFEEGAVITASAATRPSSARYSLGSRFVSSSNESTGSSSLLRQMRSDLVRERAPLRTAIRQQRHNFTATGSTLQNKHPSAPKRVITTPTTSVASTTFNEPATNTANSSDYDPVLDSDSDSDSDGFAGIMQDQMNRSMDASTAANQEKRTVQMIELPRSNWVGNTSIQQPRTQVAPRQAAPVKPRRITLDDLHYAIVQWRPSEMNDMPSTLQTKCSMAADCYRSAEEYVDVMQPLSVLECWQQISGALEMFAKQPQSCSAVLSSRSKIDDFNEIQFTCEDALDVIIENDVILLVEDPAGTLTINRQLLERNPPLGVVREINYHRDGRNIRVRTSGRNSPHCTAYHFGSHWRLIKVTSLTTIHREFEVLGRFNNYLLCNDIIRPPARQKILYDDAQLNEVAKKYAINKSQARAVLDSTTLEHGFLLIQGPPGTGKTSTILAIISSLNELAISNVIDSSDNDDSSNRVVVRRPLLVCAPSNAAIDEIVKRLCLRPDTRNLRIVRLGNLDSVHGQIKEVSLDLQVEAELTRITNPPIDPIQRCDAWVASEFGIGNTEANEPTSNSNSNQHNNDHWTPPTGWRTLSREAQRTMIRKMLVQRADIICATLSSSGHNLLASTRVRFETVLIDEASQCVELSSLIPLQYDCKRCILVGDAKQLPPTVLSARAIQLNYARSLFERIQTIQPSSVDLLTVQYRMHPLISQFPSHIFYQNQIKDGPSMAERTLASWHTHNLLGPFSFFNVADGREKSIDSRSFSNTREIDVVMGLISHICSQFPQIDFAGRIGVITPYKEQMRELRIQCSRRFGHRVRDVIDFNTIDGFQGQEKDLIIFSCVRASSSNRVGFLSDPRRMNVALTRARSSLFVVGNAETLRADSYWRYLIEEAKKRCCIYDTSTIPWLKYLLEPKRLNNLFVYPS